jgi:hypothetical protein
MSQAGTPDPVILRAMPRERRYYSVYIMGSLSGTLYVGFSGNLHKRVSSTNSIEETDLPRNTVWSGFFIASHSMMFTKP